jgi:hypothetical protein
MTMLEQQMTSTFEVQFRGKAYIVSALSEFSARCFLADDFMCSITEIGSARRVPELGLRQPYNHVNQTIREIYLAGQKNRKILSALYRWLHASAVSDFPGKEKSLARSVRLLNSKPRQVTDSMGCV